MSLKGDALYNVRLEIKDAALREVFSGYLESLPEVLRTKPSSSSGKYHNPLENGPNGLMIHSRSVVRLVDVICEANNQDDRDELKFAAACHDLAKYGRDGNELHTRRDHPLLGAQMLQDYRSRLRLKKKTVESIERIKAMIRCHSGRWNTYTENGREKKMPKPKSMDERILHWCDMISSSEWFRIQIDPERDYIQGEIPNHDFRHTP